MRPYLLIATTILAMSSLAMSSSAADAQHLLEPQMHMQPTSNGAPHIALTFDACSGKTDERILQTLIDNNIKSTIFVTARWIKRNPVAISEIKAHANLFEIENHGARHVPMVDFPTKVFGIDAAGSLDAARAEINGGTLAIEKNFGSEPKWFRGATGMYSVSAINTITDMGYKLGGYSVHGDGGASFSTIKTEKTFLSAKDGDVIIAHINQPSKPAGAGVVQAILKLKSEGVIFVKLQDGFGLPASAPVFCTRCADNAH
jgi:peptidoglycan/xylan/chitin deacetylase (PgdA/CDA1 family)